MLREQAKLFRNIAILLDVTSIFFSFYCAYRLKFPLLPVEGQLTEYDWFLFLSVPIWIGSFFYAGVYYSHRTRTFSGLLRKLFHAHCLATLLSAALIFLLKIPNFSRFLFVIYVLILFIVLVVTRLSVRLLLSWLRSSGKNTRNIIVVGEGPKADELLFILNRNSFWGLKVIGLVSSNGHEPEIVSVPVIGSMRNIVDICRSRVVDEVIFCLPVTDSRLIEPYVSRLDSMGITTRHVLDFFEFTAHRSEFSMLDRKLPIITYYAKAFDSTELFFKRIMDISGALIGLLILLLMLPFVAAAIRFESTGPVFFGQERVGENGRRFRCWKFRSMRVDAEELKQELMAQNEMNGALFKMENDPRVTRVGRFLRKTSIDEFPQFWNVLMGEMSLVGTRPPTPDEVDQYEDWHLKRICIKPGITGLWQVSGRNEITDFDEVARLDIQYVENWSLWLDVKILFQTILVVFTAKGAR